MIKFVHYKPIFSQIKQIAQFTKDYDGTRTVDHASGWHDQGGGDIKSLHVYFKKVRMPKPGKRAICLTEFGGYSYKDIEHSFNKDKTYSYKLYSTQEEFQIFLKKNGITVDEWGCQVFDR